jgi:hypothetical protein
MESVTQVSDAFLETSVLIGLVFRHAGERFACESAIGTDRPVCSRYIVFELARGFLCSLISLYNFSFEFNSFADFHQASYSGQRRFKPYQMQTWLGAFTDYFSQLESEKLQITEAQKLEEMRAKLRGWIRRGWRKVETEFNLTNQIGCRDDLPAPVMRPDQLMEQELPVSDCGNPSTCRLQGFLTNHMPDVELIQSALDSIVKKDVETRRRIESIKSLVSSLPAETFQGKCCHRCGDALICLEVPVGNKIVTKNGKHFLPLASILNKQVVISLTASSTRQPSGRPL